jgi:hypothetical protein
VGAPLEAMPVTIRVHYSLPREQMRRESLGAYPLCGIMLLSNAVSTMFTMSGGFVFRTESLIRRDMFSQHST